MKLLNPLRRMHDLRKRRQGISHADQIGANRIISDKNQWKPLPGQEGLQFISLPYATAEDKNLAHAVTEKLNEMLVLSSYNNNSLRIIDHPNHRGDVGDCSTREITISTDLLSYARDQLMGVGGPALTMSNSKTAKNTSN